ncbi:GNAT family N-acetyltransferase [Enterococcus larvae]|uniref:GNAT family N-acetyltransferase n=1 Tax=Enterococcus larvae TaxID=2794352 RepID=UPI003F2CBA92
MRQKIIMKKILASEKQLYKELQGELMSLENITAVQQQKLAQLLWEAFHGSIDDLGETPEEMEQEVTEMIAGKYGKFLGKHSFALLEENKEEFLGCGLVSFFREIPLIIYVSVSPAARGQKLSTKIMNQVMQSLAQEYEAAYLVVIEENLPARKIYQGLGFEEVGSDWDRVLNEK